MSDSRDVFQLRREGQPQAALDLARELFPQTPDDAWLIRAYGWSLHDGLKAAQQVNDMAEMQRLLAEFERLDVGDGEDDDSLRGARETWRTRVAPADGGPALAVLTQQARVASDAGNRQEALRLLREAMRRFPGLPQAATSLAWEIERVLKDLVSQEHVDGQVVRSLLQEYARLPHNEKPSLLHSLMLKHATQAVEHLKTFIPFLRWWDPTNFRSEDFQRFAPAGSDRSYDSLVERAIKAVHKAAKAEHDAENIQWAAQFVGEHLARFPEQEWFEYYYGQLLVRSGDITRARESILPIVRRKQGEFWAWDSLASTFGAEDGDKKLACLCRSLLCRTKEESFLVNVHTELGGLLVESQLYAEARFEIGKAVAIREEKGWKPADEMQRLHDWQAANWYQSAAVLESNEALYRMHAPIVETLLCEGLPVVPGVVVHNLPPRDGKAALTFVGYAPAGALVEVGVKTERFQDLDGADEGQPVSLQVDDSGSRPVIVSLERRDGSPWDVVPTQIGVVEHVNAEKGVTAVVLGRDECCLLHHDRFPEMASAEIGASVAVKVRREEKRGILRALAWETTDMQPSTSFCKCFEGSIEVREGRPFGFVDDVFVSPKLIDQVGLADADRARGLAVLELKKKRDRFGRSQCGWRALAVERVAP
jgi:tetratricopeptide (TPR) repeat protein